MDKYQQLFLTNTDTITGIGGLYNQTNRLLIHQIKKRPFSKQLVVMIASLEQARQFKEWKKEYELLVKDFWPGATTFIINQNLSLRMPNHPQLQNLIAKIGPVYMTSANLSGQKNLSLNEAIIQFPMIKKVYNFKKGSNKPSKIIKIETKEVIRE